MSSRLIIGFYKFMIVLFIILTLYFIYLMLYDLISSNRPISIKEVIFILCYLSISYIFKMKLDNETNHYQICNYITIRHLQNIYLPIISISRQPI